MAKVNMVKPMYYLLLFLLTAGICGGSQIVLDANPPAITEGVTQNFTLRCYIENKVDNATNNTGSDVSPSSYNIHHVESIIITKNSTQRIARIIPGQPAVTSPAAGNATSTGSLTADQHEHQYLDVFWPFVEQEQSGPYSCIIVAIDLEGKQVKLKTNLVVRLNQPPIGELISRINNLEEALKESNKENKEEISDIKISIDDLKTVIGLNKAPHFEQGIINMGFSFDWTVFVTERRIVSHMKFKVPYERPPLITLSVERAEFDHKFNTRYSLEVENLTNEGFDILAKTWWDSIIYSLTVRFTSFGI